MKIGIVHYRVGKTDGVSLEIEKRERLLKQMGHEVRLISGPIHNGSDCPIEELEAEYPEAEEIKEHAFASFNKKIMEVDELMQRIDRLAETIKQRFLAYHEQEQFDLLLVHNIFSYALHIAAAKSFAEVVVEANIPVIATNHDYYWERLKYSEATGREVREFINTYVPFEDERIRYISINGAAANELVRRRGIHSDLIGDVFNFQQPEWKEDSYNDDLPDTVGFRKNDIVVLQPTRVIERKGIELAMDFVKELQDRKGELIGTTLYNGKKVTGDSSVVFLVPGFSEKEDLQYREKLKRKAKQIGITALFFDEMVAHQRMEEDGRKMYSLWDTYVFADMVTYPSLFEGWGNQFIETVFARKPILVFEYPVFKSDIRNEGYSYMSLGDELAGKDEQGLVQVGPYTIQGAVSEAIHILTDPETPKMLDHNFEIGKTNHDESVMRSYLETTIDELMAIRDRRS